MLSTSLASFLLLAQAAVVRAEPGAPATPEDFIRSLDEPVAVDAVTTSMRLDDGTGVGVGAACWLLTKADPCVGTGVTIASNVGRYITDKCHGAQN